METSIGYSRLDVEDWDVWGWHEAGMAVVDEKVYVEFDCLPRCEVAGAVAGVPTYDHLRRGGSS